MPNEALIPGVDYYVESGRWVFTAHYLRRRGHCCRSGCRHCPYGFPPGGPPREGEEATGDGQDEATG